MKTLKITTYICALCAMLLMASCLDSGNETIVLNSGTSQGSEDDGLGIPTDDKAGDTPEITDPKGDIPNWPVILDRKAGYGYVSLTGIQDPETGDWLRLQGTGKAGQNVWLDIDDAHKSVSVYNMAEPETQSYAVLHDVVFLVNNSRSMNDEVSVFVSQFEHWAKTMADAGVNLRVGIVAYSEGNQSVNGAINLCTPQEVLLFLQNGEGVEMVSGFAGEDAKELADAAKLAEYYSGYNNECGVLAMHFANDRFSFRTDANRVYIMVTDEPNQPGGIERFSVECVNQGSDLCQWESQMGTVHSLFCGDTSFNVVALQTERPWMLATYTGGTSSKFKDSKFEDIPLTSFTVTHAMRHSYLLRFRLTNKYFDGGYHTVRVTVKSTNGDVRVQKTMRMRFNSLY